MPEKEKIIAHRKITPIKKRSSSCYQKKVERVTKWYNHLLKCRKNCNQINPNNKLSYKRKDLKPLDYYINKIQKPQD